MPVKAISGRVSKHAKTRLPRSVRARTSSVPPPVKGWNARDSLASMKPDEASILDNWFPEETYCRIRNGNSSHATITNGGEIESIMPYRGPDGTSVVFAAGEETVASDYRIWDVSAGGTISTAAYTALTNGRWQSTMFGNSAGNYLYMVNGADRARYYDGSAWSVEGTDYNITGVTSTNLIQLNVHKRRLFFIEKDSLSFWYLAVEGIAGAATEFRLDGLCQLGGHLVSMETWTRDGGDGLDDLAVFVTSMGEVIVYQGTDPGTAADWSLVGVFRIAPPLGRRCMFKIGADVVIMTEDGFSFLSKFISSSRLSKLASHSDNISGAVKTAVASYKSNFGWQPIFHPTGHMMLFNIPRQITDGNVQYISNTTTGAWARFTGWDANVFAVCNDDKLWYGDGAGGVWHANTGLDDNGSAIMATVRTSFIYFNPRGYQKRFTAIRPNLVADGTINVAISVNTDFEDVANLSTPTFAASGGSAWDTADWDVAEWAGGNKVHNDWLVVTGIGNTAALRMDAVVNGVELQWNATDWLYEIGGFI